uniref:Uncharacterized protein n=1 Tax=Utricularia reniformis TaxID=192314 RepID=A0A1Y0AZQ3_9LAMI|nr:hypothetical protein AEK19_MT0384 [Utricularia reniformis]ART30655.1 hypothetical protein AEK19_MT0384 [Utricularia reniformis]
MDIPSNTFLLACSCSKGMALPHLIQKRIFKRRSNFVTLARSRA